MHTKLIALATSAAFLLGAAASAKTVTLESTPQTGVPGKPVGGHPPVLHIQSGDTVIDNTVSAHSGKDPVAYFAKAGIPAKDVLKDEIDIANMPAKDQDFGLQAARP